MTAWMKLVLGLAVATVLALIAATLVIGSKVREDTVVAHPYEEGLQQTCDLAAGPCTRSLSGGGEVTLELAPRPLRTMQDLGVEATIRPAPRPSVVPDDEPAGVTVSFFMPGMEMGQNKIALLPVQGREKRDADVRFGRGVLVRCPSGRREWVAEVTIVTKAAARRTARFAFTVKE